MTTEFDLRKILNGVAGAALLAAISLSPLGASGALASSPGEHGGGGMAQEMNDEMNDNGNHDDAQEMGQEMDDDQGMGQEMDDDQGMGQGMNGDEDHRDDEDHPDRNSRPMNLQDFMNSLNNGATIAETERSEHQIRIEYSDGWEEEIENGRYELRDPRGNVVISRPAVQRDFERLNSAFPSPAPVQAS